MTPWPKTRPTQGACSRKRLILATSSRSSALAAPTNTGCLGAPLTHGRVSRGTARQQCRRSIRASWRSAGGTSLAPKEYSSKVILRHISGPARPPRQGWLKRSMRWAISPKWALGRLPISRTRRGGTGVQRVSSFFPFPSPRPSFLEQNADTPSLRSAKLSQGTRASRGLAARWSQDAKNPRVKVQDEQTDGWRMYCYVTFTSLRRMLSMELDLGQ